MCSDRSSSPSKEQRRQAEIRAVHEASLSGDDPLITRSQPWLCFMSVAEMAEMHRADNAIAPVLSALTEELFLEPSDMTTMSAETRYYFQIREELLIIDGVLYRKRPTIGTHQLILLSAYRNGLQKCITAQKKADIWALKRLSRDSHERSIGTI